MLLLFESRLIPGEIGFFSAFIVPLAGGMIYLLSVCSLAVLCGGPEVTNRSIRRLYVVSRMTQPHR